MDTENYLARCLVYIDLNMVRAGVVSHPAQWPACGCREIQDPPKRYGISDVPVLMDLLGIRDLPNLQRTHRHWVEEALQTDRKQREGHWSESLAVGNRAFVERVKARLGIAARYREICQENEACRLKEPTVAYRVHLAPKTVALSDDNASILE